MRETGAAPWGAAWRRKAQAALAIAVGAITIVNAAFFLYQYLRNTRDIAAYQSATACASANDAVNGSTCRYEGQARVLSTSRPVRLEVHVAFESLPGRTFSASFIVRNEPDSTALKFGGAIAAELWNGQITRLAGKPSDADPELDTTTPFLITALISAALALLVFFLAIPLARAAWRQK
ncbi:MAG TPA: hypothetical protein VGX22_01875 [Candidatus Dormibacteraeota bacterium]|nr:hypothetical protein [Candidatus Dormibacteraeota bacterium]